MREKFQQLLILLPLYALFFVFPVVAMMGCERWIEASGAVSSCFIDSSVLQSYADIYYRLITVAAILVLVAILVYSVIGLYFGRAKLFGSSR